jgi:hypothetical protein
VLGIQIWSIEMEEATSTNIFPTFCHRMTYDFAQDPFCNKCQREKCVLLGDSSRCNPSRKKSRQNEERDSPSFAELGSLVRMNDWIKIT